MPCQYKREPLSDDEVNPALRVNTRGFFEVDILMHPYIPVLKNGALRGAG